MGKVSQEKRLKTGDFSVIIIFFHNVQNQDTILEFGIIICVMSQI